MILQTIVTVLTVILSVSGGILKEIDDPRCFGSGLDYLPDPVDCTKYIECYEGDSYVVSCPPGLWFNAELKICTSKENSNCVASTPPPTSTDHPGNPCQGVHFNRTELRPVVGDCTKYWECFGERAQIMDCNPGLYFHYVKQWCDWPWLADCDDQHTPDPHTSTSPEPSTTPHDGDDPRCVDSGIHYYPHPSDCRKYIECHNGHSYEMECPSGLYFDPVNSRCEDPATSNCGKSTPTLGPMPTDWTPHPDCPWDGGSYLFPYHGDCTKYWECVGGDKIIMECPPDLWFNPDLLVCDYPILSGCEN